MGQSRRSVPAVQGSGQQATQPHREPRRQSCKDMRVLPACLLSVMGNLFKEETVEKPHFVGALCSTGEPAKCLGFGNQPSTGVADDPSDAGTPFAQHSMCSGPGDF